MKQRTQSKAEYDYLTLLKKNTEDIGSIFGPLPVQLTGNVHASGNADELGYWLRGHRRRSSEAHFYQCQ